MSTTTQNFKLKKPESLEYYDIGVHNDNMDSIDAYLKALNDGKAGADQVLVKTMNAGTFKNLAGDTLIEKIKHVPYNTIVEWWTWSPLSDFPDQCEGVWTMQLYQASEELHYSNITLNYSDASGMQFRSWNGRIPAAGDQVIWEKIRDHRDCTLEESTPTDIIDYTLSLVGYDGLMRRVRIHEGTNSPYGSGANDFVYNIWVVDGSASYFYATIEAYDVRTARVFRGVIKQAVFQGWHEIVTHGMSGTDGYWIDNRITTGNQKVLNVSSDGGSVYYGNPETTTVIESLGVPKINMGGIGQAIMAYMDGAGDISARLFRASHPDESRLVGAVAFRVNAGKDNYTRYCSSPTALRQWMGSENGIGVYCTNLNTTTNDWNDVSASGWYMGSADITLNCPPGGDDTTWYYGYVIKHNDDWMVQRAHAFTGDNCWYERHYRSATLWTDWTRDQKITTSTTAPTSPGTGDLWVE